MRQQRTYKLDDTSVVIVRDMDLERIASLATFLESLPDDDVEIGKLLIDNIDQLQALLGDCIQLPENKTLKTLFYNEIVDIINIFMELHPNLLQKKIATTIQKKHKTK